MDTLRIVLLGKTGYGKSSSGNTILGKKSFKTNSSPNSITHECESKMKCKDQKSVMVVDTPGFFDTDLSEEELKSEILRCVVECAPGPHAFVIVLKVGRYTKHEKDTVKEITDSFGEEALKYSVLLFTYGDELSEDERIEDFVKRNTELQELVDKCGGRVHVIDNKHWANKQGGYRSNRVQVKMLLNTIEEMVMKNGGGYYSSEMLQLAQRKLNAMRTLSKEKAKENAHREMLERFGGNTAAGVLAGLIGGALLAVLAVLKP